MKAVYKRELKSYFHSMIGYVFIAFLTFFMGIYFWIYNLLGGYPYFSYALSGVLLMMIIAVPVLSMRILADERRAKTDQLLLTSPLSVTRIILGKYLAMVTVWAVPMLIGCLCPLIIRMNGTAYLLEDYSAILAFFLLGCVFLSIGLFVSSLTESQLIAALLTIGALLLAVFWPDLVSNMSGSLPVSLIASVLIWSAIVAAVYRRKRQYGLCWALEGVGAAVLLVLFFLGKNNYSLRIPFIRQLGKIALLDVYGNFTNNHLFDAGGLVFYISVIFLFIFLTVQSVEKRRWS